MVNKNLQDPEVCPNSQKKSCKPILEITIGNDDPLAFELVEYASNKFVLSKKNGFSLLRSSLKNWLIYNNKLSEEEYQIWQYNKTQNFYKSIDINSDSDSKREKSQCSINSKSSYNTRSSDDNTVSLKDTLEKQLERYYKDVKEGRQNCNIKLFESDNCYSNEIASNDQNQVGGNGYAVGVDGGSGGNFEEKGSREDEGRIEINKKDQEETKVGSIVEAADCVKIDTKIQVVSEVITGFSNKVISEAKSKENSQEEPQEIPQQSRQEKPIKELEEKQEESQKTKIKFPKTKQKKSKTKKPKQKNESPEQQPNTNPISPKLLLDGKPIKILQEDYNYVGQLTTNGERHGQGTLHYKDNNNTDIIYEGMFHNHLRHGQGQYKTGFGEYKGEFQNDVITGKGEWKSELEYYKGDWLNYRKHGYGEIEYIKIGMTYKGQWANDKKNGKGEMWFKNKEFYVGDFVDDKFHGCGKYTFYDKSWYDGEWAENTKKGKGEWQFSSGAFYKGEFDNDVRDGKGLQIYPGDHRYEGEWVADHIQGWGTWYRKQFNKFIGNWSDHGTRGIGEIFWADGSSYKGEWMNFKQHGKGESYIGQKKKLVYKGEYKYGMFHGFGEMTTDCVYYKGPFFLNKKALDEGFSKPDQCDGNGCFSSCTDEKIKQELLIKNDMFYEWEYRYKCKANGDEIWKEKKGVYKDGINYQYSLNDDDVCIEEKEKEAKLSLSKTDKPKVEIKSFNGIRPAEEDGYSIFTNIFSKIKQKNNNELKDKPEPKKNEIKVAQTSQASTTIPNGKDMKTNTTVTANKKSNYNHWQFYNIKLQLESLILKKLNGFEFTEDQYWLFQLKNSCHIIKNGEATMTYRRNKKNFCYSLSIQLFFIITNTRQSLTLEGSLILNDLNESELDFTLSDLEFYDSCDKNTQPLAKFIRKSFSSHLIILFETLNNELDEIDFL